MLCLFPPPLRGTARRAGEGRSCGRGFSPELLLSPLPLRATVRRAEKGALTHPAKQSARPPEQIAWHVQFPNSTRRAKCSDRKAICLARKANNSGRRANNAEFRAQRPGRRVHCSDRRAFRTEVRAIFSERRADFFAAAVGAAKARFRLVTAADSRVARGVIGVVGAPCHPGVEAGVARCRPIRVAAA